LDTPSRALDRFNSWPVWLQILGGLGLCFGIGMIAGLGWGIVTLSLHALVSGILAEK
jgi:hypothetical protein